MRLAERMGWALAGALAIAILAVAARDAQGGALDPPGPPGPTMQSLNQMPPDWMFQLSAQAQSSCNSSRFTCVMLRQTCSNQVCFFTYDGVLDHETGLVWQRDLASWNPLGSWEEANTFCLNYKGGGRMGWHLPTLAEAESLLDPTVKGSEAVGGASLPPGHPFILPFPLIAWTSTRYLVDDHTLHDVYVVFYQSPNQVGLALPWSDASDYFFAWCVRGAS
jgi:hypothetical protein